MTAKMEIWKPVCLPLYSDKYEVSNFGNVRSLSRVLTNNKKLVGRVLKPATVKNYHMVLLWSDGVKKFVRVHHLVAHAFIGNPDGKIGKSIDDYQCNHIDGNTKNNHYSNLEWLSVKDHQIHSESLNRRPRGEKQHLAVLTNELVKSIRNDFSNGKKIYEIANAFNLTHSTVSHVVHNRTWKHII
jgi:hypothetical protein